MCVVGVLRYSTATAGCGLLASRRGAGIGDSASAPLQFRVYSLRSSSVTAAMTRSALLVCAVAACAVAIAAAIPDDGGVVSAPTTLVPVLPFSSVDKNHDEVIDQAEYSSYATGQLPGAPTYPIDAVRSKPSGSSSKVRTVLSWRQQAGVWPGVGRASHVPGFSQSGCGISSSSLVTPMSTRSLLVFKRLCTCSGAPS